MAFHPLTSLRVFGANNDFLFTANIGVEKVEARQVTTRSLAFSLPKWKVKSAVAGLATSSAAQFLRQKVSNTIPFCDGTTDQKFVGECHRYMPNLPRFLAKVGLADTSEKGEGLTFTLDSTTGLPCEVHGVTTQRSFIYAIQGVMDSMSNDMILDENEHLTRLVAGSRPFAQLKGTEDELDGIVAKWSLMRANDNARVEQARKATTAQAIMNILKERASNNGLSATGFVNMKKAKDATTSLGEEDYWDLLDEEDEAPNTEANPDTTSPTA